MFRVIEVLPDQTRCSHDQTTGAIRTCLLDLDVTHGRVAVASRTWLESDLEEIRRATVRSVWVHDSRQRLQYAHRSRVLTIEFMVNRSRFLNLMMATAFLDRTSLSPCREAAVRLASTATIPIAGKGVLRPLWPTSFKVLGCHLDRTVYRDRADTWGTESSDPFNAAATAGAEDSCRKTKRTDERLIKRSQETVICLGQVLHDSHELSVSRNYVPF